MSSKRFMVFFGLLVILSMILAACQPSATPTAGADNSDSADTATQAPASEGSTEGETEEGVEEVSTAFTTPHPVLSDIRVRRAMAYCTNKEEIIKAVYPLLTDEERSKLVMDSWIPKSHWAYAGEENLETYPFDIEKGKALLDEAGWTDPEESGMRMNANGDPLSLQLVLTEAPHRKIWAAVWQQQMSECGFRIAVNHVPATWLYGDTTGLARRDYELSGFAWQGQSDPQGRSTYGCDMIPLPSNDWLGQNNMGWCNETAHKYIVQATNTLNQADRVEPYKLHQIEFMNDMVSLPLFNHLEVFATTPTLEGFKPVPGEEFYTYNINEWEIPGKDTIVIGFTQEPSTLFTLVEQGYSVVVANTLIQGMAFTTMNYDFQPAAQSAASTLDSGLAKNEEVEVKQGDKVLDVNGSPVTLEPGIKVFDSTGKEVEFTGEPLKMMRLTVEYKFRDDLTWSDGTPVTAADYDLRWKTDCDKEAGAITYTNCDNTLSYTTSDSGYTVTYLPGVQDPMYFRSLGDPRTSNYYPAHRVLSDGRTLADVPASEWATLPEIAQNPIGVGPYVLKEWVRGEKLVFEANPYYWGGAPKTKYIIIAIVSPDNAEAQLLSGQIDVLDNTTLTSITETLASAAEEGTIKLYAEPGGTWEHVDVNLFLP